MMRRRGETRTIHLIMEREHVERQQIELEDLEEEEAIDMIDGEEEEEGGRQEKPGKKKRTGGGRGNTGRRGHYEAARSRLPTMRNMTKEEIDGWDTERLLEEGTKLDIKLSKDTPTQCAAICLPAKCPAILKKALSNLRRKESSSGPSFQVINEIVRRHSFRLKVY